MKFLTFFCNTFLKFLQCWSEYCSREYCFNIVYITFLLTVWRRHNNCAVLTIFNTLWSARYVGWKVDVVWILIKTNCPIFKSEALSNFFSSTGSLVSLESQSSSACSLYIYFSLSTASCSGSVLMYLQYFEDGLVYLQVDPCQKLRRMVTQGC